jgi:FlaA1/EpsC-like NDP-sugar epimerase
MNMRQPRSAHEESSSAFTRSNLTRVTANLGELIESGRRIIIWGAGSLTMNLLSDPSFGRLNIVAFVDANPHYWNKTIRGLPILAPDRVRDALGMSVPCHHPMRHNPAAFHAHRSDRRAHRSPI